MNYLLVFLGGGIGSMLRFGVGKVFAKWETDFPLATLVSNLTACLIFTMILSIRSVNTLTFPRTYS